MLEAVREKLDFLKILHEVRKGAKLRQGVETMLDEIMEAVTDGQK